MKNIHRIIALGVSTIALASCGADDVVVPNNSVVVNPAPSPSPSPTSSPTPTPGVTAAASCTGGTTDQGIITLQNGRGTIRNCQIPNQITGSLQLGGTRASGIMYSMNGRTEVGTDVAQAGTGATLTILPGVTVFAASRETTLIVNRGSRLFAEGTANSPIIFTALQNLTTTVTDSTDNLWGGIALAGRAPISDCSSTLGSSTVGGDANCWQRIEGISPNVLYGGNVANDSSGSMRYLQVNFTGVGAGGDEVQGITTGGVGSGTTMEFIQIHNSRDDGIEVFGGRQNMKNLVFTGISDDSFDTDFGYQGSVQFMLAVRRAAGTDGDSANGEVVWELDSSANPDALPRQKLKVANFTLIQNTPNEPAIRLRGGADAVFANGIVIAPDTTDATNSGCLDVDNSETVRAADAGLSDDGPPVLQSVVFDCDVVEHNDSDTLEATTLTGASNANVNTGFVGTLQFLMNALVGLIAPGANETAVTPVANLPALSSFFTQVNYIGAFSGPGDTWTAGWTCDSDVADLNGATNCTDIRIN